MATLRAYWRFVLVAWHFLPLLLAYARDRHRFLLFGSARQVSSETRRERAEVLLDSLFTLGPTFIKLGQLLSARPDVLPPEYVETLSALQDEVPPAEWSEAKAVLEDELGPVDERFDDFETEALSGASLGQVYRARVDGQPVAVKVRRPGVESLVAADLRVIRWSMPILLALVDESRAFSLSNLADEFGKTIREEMDYEREARMLAEIRSNFAGDDRYVIPDVLESHSGARVLTMEYVSGTKISDVEALEAAGHDRSRLAEHLQVAYMQMILGDGVFHADPHPGNLAVTDDGRIVFYDFGMSGRVDDFVQETIVDFYLAVANRDIDAILDALIEVGTLSPDADRAVMAEVMELAIQDARGQEVEQYRVQQIVGQVEDSIYEFPFRLPANLALVLRVATVVEGVCVTLDPEFDFVSTATDYLADEGYREETARRYLEETREQVGKSLTSAIRLGPKAERTLDRLDRGNLYVRVGMEDAEDTFETLGKRLVYGMVLSATLFSAAFLYTSGALLATGVTLLVAGGLAVQLYRSFRRQRSIQATPEFTRQRMRRRRREE